MIDSASDLSVLEVQKAIWKRCSVRRFTDTQIQTDQISKLVEAGIRAPSGSNWQNQRFLVIDDADEIMRIGKSRFVWPYRNANMSKLKESHPAGIIGEATALIIVFSDSLSNDRRGNGEFYIWEALEIQNCAASIENILIMATAMKLASCWVSASDNMNYTRLFSGQSWRKLLSNYEIPNYFKLQGIVLLGYPTAVDEEGFPKGEAKHGATVFQSTERKPVDYYCIKSRKQNVSGDVEVSFIDRLLVRFLSRSLTLFQRASCWCDRKIHRVEIEKYLMPKSASNDCGQTQK